MPRAVATSYEENVQFLNETLGVGKTFDLIFKEFEVRGRRYAVYYVNGFGQDLLQFQILRELTEGHLGPDPEKALKERRFSYPPLTTTKDLDAFVFQILSGPMGVIVEGSDEALILDTRKYPDRSPSEPDTERVIMGPRDSFIETLLFNCALIRRRMRDPRLRFELFQIGRHTKVDVAIGYVEGYTSEDFVQAVRERLQAIDVAGVAMAEETVEENLGKHPWNPFPVVRVTERPDVAAENLLEGRVAIMVDTSPMVIVAPMTYLSHLHHPEDYHVSPATGTFLRWISLGALVVGTWLTPVWLVLALHPLPALKMIGPSKPPTYPLLAQLLVAEFGIDVIRRSVLNSPSIIATSMSILAAVILGQLATKAKIFTPEVLVYSAVVAIALFAVPSLQLGMAHRLVRIVLLILGGLFSWWGLAAGFVAMSAVLLSTSSFGIPYLWPLIPLDVASLTSILIRQPLTFSRKGPKAILHLKPQRGGAV